MGINIAPPTRLFDVVQYSYRRAFDLVISRHSSSAVSTLSRMEPYTLSSRESVAYVADFLWGKRRPRSEFDDERRSLISGINYSPNRKGRFALTMTTAQSIETGPTKMSVSVGSLSCTCSVRYNS